MLTEEMTEEELDREIAWAEYCEWYQEFQNFN